MKNGNAILAVFKYRFDGLLFRLITVTYKIQSGKLKHDSILSQEAAPFFSFNNLYWLYRLHGRVVKGVAHLGYDEAMEAGGREFSLHGRVVKGVGHLRHDGVMEAGGREFSLHGRVVKGVGHLRHDEVMEAGGREFSLHGRVVKGVGHLGNDEAMEAGGREFDPRPGHYSRMGF